MTPAAKPSSLEIDRLIERQLRNWELARAQRENDRPTNQPIHDFVTVSRQAGSGGTEIARNLAERLKWPVFDREILHAMAGDDARREQVYGWMDEREVGWLEEMLEYIVQGRNLPHDYEKKLTRALLAITRGAPAILLGRAADLILPRDRGVRVRVVAPFEMRVERYAAETGLSVDQARKEVARIDRERSKFIRDHFDREPDDPTRSDLTINTESVSFAEAVELIHALLKRRRIS